MATLYIHFLRILPFLQPYFGVVGHAFAAVLGGCGMCLQQCLGLWDKFAAVLGVLGCVCSSIGGSGMYLQQYLGLWYVFTAVFGVLGCICSSLCNDSCLFFCLLAYGHTFLRTEF